MRSEYECVVCKRKFEAMHFQEARMFIGRTIECCNQAAKWIRNISEKKEE